MYKNSLWSNIVCIKFYILETIKDNLIKLQLMYGCYEIIYDNIIFILF